MKNANPDLMRTLGLATLMMGLMLPGQTAVGQVVTPPPGTVVKPEERLAKPQPAPTTPPPPTQPPAQPGEPTPTPPPGELTPGEVPAMVPPVFAPPPELMENMPRANSMARPKMNELPELEFTSLIVRDEAGKIVPVMELAEVAALRVNPTLPENFPGQLGAYLDERKTTFERIVVNNLDLLELVEQGIIENADYDKIEGIRHVVSTLRPLDVPHTPKRVTDDLQEKGMIDGTQAQFNMKITGEYCTQVAREAKAPEGVTKPDPRASGLIAKAMRRFAVQESEIRYRALMSEAAEKMGTLAGEMELPEGLKATATAAGKEYRASMTEDEKIALYHKATGKMDVHQRRALLEKMIETRK